VAAVVVESDPASPGEFQAERVLLAEALREWLVDDVHHIGSTAVPGLPANPILDMIAGVGRLGDADAVEPALAAFGYERVPAQYVAADKRTFVRGVLADAGVHLRADRHDRRYVRSEAGRKGRQEG
jgi:GrpB-like predicted nucleotidyltransferase (UPF0157 family)